MSENSSATQAQIAHVLLHRASVGDKLTLEQKEQVIAYISGSELKPSGTPE